MRVESPLDDLGLPKPGMGAVADEPGTILVGGLVPALLPSGPGSGGRSVQARIHDVTPVSDQKDHPRAGQGREQHVGAVGAVRLLQHREPPPPPPWTVDLSAEAAEHEGAKQGAPRVLKLIGEEVARRFAAKVEYP
jgi:hypothetical protein